METSQYLPQPEGTVFYRSSERKSRFVSITRLLDGNRLSIDRFRGDCEKLRKLKAPGRWPSWITGERKFIIPVYISESFSEPIIDATEDLRYDSFSRYRMIHPIFYNPVTDHLFAQDATQPHTLLFGVELMNSFERAKHIARSSLEEDLSMPSNSTRFSHLLRACFKDEKQRQEIAVRIAGISCYPTRFDRERYDRVRISVVRILVEKGSMQYFVDAHDLATTNEDELFFVAGNERPGDHETWAKEMLDNPPYTFLQ